MTPHHLNPLGAKKLINTSFLLFIFLSGLLLFEFKYSPTHVAFNYLLAFTFLISLALGGLFFSMLQHATSAGWRVVVRRIAESFTHLLPIGIILALPIFWGIPLLFHWSHPDVMAHNHLLARKASYLNPTFFIIRTFIYFLVWTFLYRKIIRPSLAQDHTGNIHLTHHMKKWSCVGFVLFAITLTFAATDWMMSLKADWFSTIYGVYFFSGSVVASLALIIMVILMLQKQGYLTEINEHHFHDLGKLLYALNIFWAYIAFSQYMLIWYGNIPEETIFFAERGARLMAEPGVRGWQWLSLGLFTGHFIIPFFFLMSRHAKRNLKVLFWGATWLLMMHYVDLFWLIMPNFSKTKVIFGWVEITTLLWMMSLFVLVLVWNLRKHALIPLKDPRLQYSLEFHQ